MKILLIFIDGMGLGRYDAASNPFVRFDPRFFKDLFGQPLTIELGRFYRPEGCLVPTDACLGVPGLPQSATGQTAIFTGVNAPQLMSRHIPGFPGPALAGIIREHGIMRRLAEQGFAVTSANMYTPGYHELVTMKKRRYSVTTLVILEAGIALRSLPEMQQAQAVYQDLTNDLLLPLELPGVTSITPAEAGRRLVNIAENHHFTMFEYFQTDRYGHKQNWLTAEQVTRQLDEFLCAVRDSVSSDMTVVITSDHGNFEDLSVKTHTNHAVPTIIMGSRCQEAATQINDLTHITPVILSLLKGENFYD
ncbi:metalloenzyme [Anaerospora hongkongensis]|uniref:metalloenzyme n=1 Tax=Anaerospora hongkongensis TaxID=244830 RepID=UPI0028A09F40|nr:metalloenzyme [Anaerospora hongkongensis]